MEATKTKNWPTDSVIVTSSSWVEKHPRPKDGDGHPALVALRQEQWDAANERYQRHMKRAAETQTKREAAEAIVHAREQAKRHELETVLRRRFIIAGGSAAEWEAQKERLVAEHIKQTALTSNEDPARQAQAGL